MGRPGHERRTTAPNDALAEEPPPQIGTSGVSDDRCPERPRLVGGTRRHRTACPSALLRCRRGPAAGSWTGGSCSKARRAAVPTTEGTNLAAGISRFFTFTGRVCDVCDVRLETILFSPRLASASPRVERHACPSEGFCEGERSSRWRMTSRSRCARSVQTPRGCGRLPKGFSTTLRFAGASGARGPPALHRDA